LGRLFSILQTKSSKSCHNKEVCCGSVEAGLEDVGTEEKTMLRFKELEEKIMMKIDKLSPASSLEDARMRGPPTKTLLMKYYSKRSGFRGKLKCPEEECGHIVYSGKGYWEHHEGCHKGIPILWPEVIRYLVKLDESDDEKQ